MSRIGIALTAAIVTVAVGVAVFLVTPEPQRETDGAGEDGGGRALIGGPFTLVDHEGRTRTEEDFLGRPMLVFFGFTHCPDVCPTGLQTMSDALDRLGPLGKRVQPVFISVDPERDTVEVVADYLEHFHPRMVGLTGSPEQVATAAEAYRVYYAKQASGEEDYLVDHSAFTYLMDAEGTYVTHFNHGISADAMAERIRENLAPQGS